MEGIALLKLIRAWTFPLLAIILSEKEKRDLVRKTVI